MAERRFFSAHEPVNGQVAVDGDECHHIVHVMRYRSGDDVEIVNGRGRLIHGHIAAISSHSLQVAVRACTDFPKPPLRVVIAPSLTKGHAMNWLVEKLAELGVDEIRPLACERTDVAFGPSQLRRWEKIAAQSLKVNRKYWLTRLFAPVSPADIVVAAEKIPGKILLDIDADQKLERSSAFPVLAAVGPPGDFSAAEKELFRENGFRPALVNDGILKTETAAVAIAAILKND